jgi:hypothetical protein
MGVNLHPADGEAWMVATLRARGRDEAARLAIEGRQTGANCALERRRPVAEQQRAGTVFQHQRGHCDSLQCVRTVVSKARRKLEQQRAVGIDLPGL